MGFKEGDRVHVRMLHGGRVDFYATLRIFDEFHFKLTDCSNTLFNNFKVYRPNTEEYRLNDCYYYTLVTEETKGLKWSDGSSAEGTPIMCDEEDTENPVIQHTDTLDNGEIIAQSIVDNRDGASFISAHEMIVFLSEVEEMHGETISVKGWNLIFDYIKASIAPAYFGRD